MTTIRLHNTATRKKEVFTPLDPKNVRMYVCGPTVYDRAHIGNARPVVIFDVLYRLLRHVYGADHVTYVRNFTDVDDKINAKAVETGRTIREITDETIGWYHDDMDALGALRPSSEPRATEFIGPMIAMIETLIAKGHAYAAEGHVLFDVRSYAAYGRLSGRSVDDMIAGARVEVAPFKRDPMDFVLWKPSDTTQPGWNSPWGFGRPGWHIECSAMADTLLGPSFDIHGGGIDLQFPHHENEIAQSRCAHPHADFARVWMHNEMLQVEGKKMSKSLGNFFTVRELIAEYDEIFAIENIGPAIRLRFLETHYRSPIDVGRSYIEAAATKLGQWSRIIEEAVFGVRPAGIEAPAAVLVALADDLNTPLAITIIDKLVDELKRPLPNGSNIDASAEIRESNAWQILAAIEMLGFKLDEIRKLQHRYWSDRMKLRQSSRNPAVIQMIEELLEERAIARKSKNFERADELRVGFSAAGLIVKDTPQGAEWALSETFDPSKLDGLK